MAEDCYFFVDPDPNIPEKDRTMGVLCLECHNTHMPNTGWFYQGSKEGYGPFDYQCRRCGKCISKADDEEDEEDEDQTSD